MPAKTIVSLGDIRSDDFWDEKLHGADDGIQVMEISQLGIFKADERVSKHRVAGMQPNTTIQKTNCQRARISIVKKVEGRDAQVTVKDGKDYGTAPSRDPSERYDRPSKDCLWDGVGRQPAPKGLSGRQDDNDEEEDQTKEDIGGGPGDGHNPGDNDDGEPVQRQVANKAEPPSLLVEPKLVLDSISNVTAKAELLKLRRLEHGQLEYFPIYGNCLRYQPLRTEHHCSWSAKIDLTFEDRPIITPQQIQEHYSGLPEAMELRERWMKKQRWRRLRTSLAKGDIKKAINDLSGVCDGA